MSCCEMHSQGIELQGLKFYISIQTGTEEQPLPFSVVKWTWSCVD